MNKWEDYDTEILRLDKLDIINALKQLKGSSRFQIDLEGTLTTYGIHGIVTSFTFFAKTRFLNDYVIEYHLTNDERRNLIKNMRQHL